MPEAEQTGMVHFLFVFCQNQLWCLKLPDGETTPDVCRYKGNDCTYGTQSTASEFIDYMLSSYVEQKNLQITFVCDTSDTRKLAEQALDPKTASSFAEYTPELADKIKNSSVTYTMLSDLLPRLYQKMARRHNIIRFLGETWKFGDHSVSPVTAANDNPYEMTPRELGRLLFAPAARAEKKTGTTQSAKPICPPHSIKQTDTSAKKDTERTKKTVKPIAQTATKDRTLQPEKPTELQKYIIKSHVKKGTW